MSRIAIIVPGIGYTTDRSLLYFAGKVAQNAGYELQKIQFSGFEKGVKGNPEKMKRAFSHAYEQLLEKQGRSRRSDMIIFHGLADPWAADNDSMRVIAEQRGVEYHELPGANHSLETGNPIVDMDSQKKTMEICQRFLYA